MSANFNYSISGQTLNGKINLEKINRDFYKIEINETIVSISPIGDNLLFSFQEPLNNPELLNQKLDDFVASHDGFAISPPRILSIVGEANKNEDFTQIDYKILPKPNLFPKREFVRGELRSVEWYKESTFETMVLKVTMQYTRDLFGFAKSRITTRVWFDEEGEELEPKKVTTKVYSNLEQIKEGKRRRGNIVDGIQLPTMSFMVETMTVEPWNLTQAQILLTGRDFMDRFSIEFKNFIDNSSTVISGPNAGKKSVIVALENAAASTDAWLMNTPQQLGGQVRILDYLTNEFSI